MDDSDELGQADTAATDIAGADAAPADWHPADIQAALKKRGFSLAGLSAANGYHATAAGKALKRPWPAMEILIAEAIGISPHEIWPNRYKAHTMAHARSRGPIEQI